MTDTINTRELIMNILLEMDREKTPCHLAVRDALDKYQFLPRQDRAFIKRVCEGTVEYGIQVNGKIRARVELPADMDKDAIQEKALALPEVQNFTRGKTIRKVIVVKNIVNIVVG